MKRIFSLSEVIADGIYYTQNIWGDYEYIDYKNKYILCFNKVEKTLIKLFYKQAKEILHIDGMVHSIQLSLIEDLENNNLSDGVLEITEYQKKKIIKYWKDSMPIKIKPLVKII